MVLSIFSVVSDVGVSSAHDDVNVLARKIWSVAVGVLPRIHVNVVSRNVIFGVANIRAYSAVDAPMAVWIRSDGMSSANGLC